MIIGIDNGVSTGALVALSESGPIIATLPMPCVMHRTRNEVDLESLHQWLLMLEDPTDAVFVIEEPNNARNASTAYSMAACFHALRGYLTARRRNIVRITPAWSHLSQSQSQRSFACGDSLRNHGSSHLVVSVKRLMIRCPPVQFDAF